MKPIFALIPLAATAAVLVISPAAAKSRAHYLPEPRYEEPYAYAPAPYLGSADPSYRSPGYDQARRLGRCVEDLGYGRYEYCD